MTGQHRKQTKWTLKIGGAAVAGAALTSTFALAAQAAQAATPAENTALRTVATKSAPQASQNSTFLALAQTPVTALGAPVAPKAARGHAKPKNAKPKAAEPKAAASKPNRAQTAQANAAQRLASAQDVLALAEKQVGIRESSSGQTKFSQWYSNSSRALETIDRDGGNRKAYLAASWCDMFVSWVAVHSGGKTASTVGQDAWTIAHAKWFKAQGRWGTKPKPGAVAFFDWNGGKSLSGIRHVGYVVSAGANGKVNTIEGNTSNAVMKRVRSSSQIVGYGYPEYAK